MIALASELFAQHASLAMIERMYRAVSPAMKLIGGVLSFRGASEF